MFKAESYVGHKLCWPGDLVINSLWAWMQGLGFSQHFGLVSPAYSVYRPKPDLASGFRYFHYLLRSSAYKWELMTRSKGVWLSRLQLSDAAFLDMPIMIPPPDEQNAIVRYLDYVDRRVRRYIAAKRKLIALLNEEKQAIIHQAVTRGLDPDVRLKPSGVEWLGDVPEHWEVSRLKYVATVQTGITLGKHYGSTALEERPYLRVANVQNGFLDLNQVTWIKVPSAEAASSELRVGDVLMTEGGDRDKLGRGAIWRGEVAGCLHQNHVFAVRAERERLLPEFLVLLMTSPYGRLYFDLTAKQTTNLASTNSTTLKALPILLPEVSEQVALLDQIAQQTAYLEETIVDTWKQIDLVREYRARLIADVVTGKLDVRAVAADLTAEEGQVIGEPEAVDAEMLEDAEPDAEDEEAAA
jgi:type I restriction enzyme S subunit